MGEWVDIVEYRDACQMEEQKSACEHCFMRWWIIIIMINRNEFWRARPMCVVISDQNENDPNWRERERRRKTKKTNNTIDYCEFNTENCSPTNEKTCERFYEFDENFLILLAIVCRIAFSDCNRNISLRIKPHSFVFTQSTFNQMWIVSPLVSIHGLPARSGSTVDGALMKWAGRTRLLRNSLNSLNRRPFR